MKTHHLSLVKLLHSFQTIVCNTKFTKEYFPWASVYASDTSQKIIYASIFMPTDSDSPMNSIPLKNNSIHCMLHPLCVVFYQNVILCNFFVINFFPTSEDSEKNSSPDQKFAVEKPLISNETLRTNCTYAKWTNIYGHQKSNIFSNDTSRCCFESSNGREGNCVLSRGFIIPSVREFFSCVIIFAKSCWWLHYICICLWIADHLVLKWSFILKELIMH